MPIISSTAPPAPSPSPQKSEIKPIGICLSNSGIEMPSMATSTVANNLPNARNMVSAVNSNSFYPSVSTVGSAPGGSFQMGGLSVMVAKFTSNQNNSASRQQTVILQPRINTTRAATLQMNPIRGSAIIASQNSATSSISVRTRVISGSGHPSNTVPVLNLSTVTNAVTSVNSPATNTVKQVIKGPKFIASAGNVETLIMTAPSDVRSIRTNPANNEIKTSMLTVHNMKVNGPKSVLPTSTIVAQPKMISINNAGQTTAGSPRTLGLIGTGVANKPGIINLASNMQKGFILTAPNTTLTASGPGMPNVVSLSSANFVPGGQPTKISVTPNHQIISATTTRHSVTSANALSQNNLPSPKATIYTVATTSANVLNSVASLPHTATISTLQPTTSFSQNLSAATVTISPATLSTSPLVNVNVAKPTFLTANLSPVKPPILTPNSPRPRILSRKRVHPDSPTTIKVANGTLLPCHSTTGNNIIDLKSHLSLGPPSMGNCVDSLQQVNNGVKIENSVVSTAAVPLSSDSNLTPRKKPRKQLLEPTSPKREPEHEHDEHIDGEEPQLPKREVEKDRVLMIKRPRPALNLYREPPKTLPHFLRHADVRQKAEKKVSITDLLSDAQKQNVGWKVNHMAEQLTKSSLEETGTLQNRLENFLRVLENDISPFSSCASTSTLFGADAEKLDFVDKICVKINDLTRANIQRTKVIIDHYSESKKLLLNLTTDHKEKVTSLAKRIGHKRGYIK